MPDPAQRAAAPAPTPSRWVGSRWSSGPSDTRVSSRCGLADVLPGLGVPPVAPCLYGDPPLWFSATGGLGVPGLSPEAGTEDEVGMAWSGGPAALGGRTRAGEGGREKAAPRGMMWAAPSRSPCRRPAPTGRSLPSQSTRCLWPLTRVAWPRSGRLAPRRGRWVGQSAGTGGSGVRGQRAASLSACSGQRSSSPARAPRWWAVGGAGGQRALSGPARQPGSLRRAGPRVPASRDPGGSLALKSL